MAIVGAVAADGSEDRIPLTVLGAPGGTREPRAERFEAVIDTGITGQLTLPPGEVLRLGLTPLGSRYVTLADGSEAPLDVFRATVVWDGRRRNVRAFATDGDLLVGMTLLSGSRLTVDVVPGGDLVIEALD